MTKSLEFFFDFTSTYSYLASTRIEAMVRDTGVTLHWRPFLLGVVFKATDNVAPLVHPSQAKVAYLLKDIRDWTRHYGLPEFRLPDVFPVPSLKANRLALVAIEQGKGPAFIHATYAAIFQQGRDLGDLEVLGELAAAAGLDAGAALERMEDPAIKAALKANTDEAVARGAFGAPTLFLGDDLYFGNDRLPLVERALQRG